jgi:predicted nuclease of predicted toxin-antitoxin system
VRLLFDENLSFRLVAILRVSYPDCTHVRDVGLVGASDQRIWEFARSNGWTIVSKDNDFRQRTFVEGMPPKVVWLDVGNDGTTQIASLLERSRAALERFDAEAGAGLLVLSKTRGTP